MTGVQTCALPISDPRDRRAGPRRDGNVIEALLSDAAAQASPETIWVLDRGCGGLRLAVNRECPLATILSIRTCAAPPETPWVAVAVRHTRPVNGRWELGCQFVEPPPWNVLLLFG